MNRRDSFKTLLIGTMAGAALGAGSCNPAAPGDNEGASDSKLDLYGRTPAEKARDKKLLNQSFFTTHELESIAILCDIILPATAEAGSAVEAGVPEFIAFIAKDIPNHQVPLRGGLMWLDTECNRRFNTEFKSCNQQQQIRIIEDIAYPEKVREKPMMAPGIQFFTQMRNLTLTGYYTSQMGIKDLGYAGNRPNVWDGVPEEVLEKHDVGYDPEWLAKCIDQETRNTKAEWDDEGNLIS